MQALMTSRKLKKPVFGFYLGDHEDGQLVLGGVDDRHYEGQFHFMPVVSTAYWQVMLDNIKVGDAEGHQTGSFERYRRAVAIFDEVGELQACHHRLRKFHAGGSQG